jgi:hypothetical protein
MENLGWLIGMFTSLPQTEGSRPGCHVVAADEKARKS